MHPTDGSYDMRVFGSEDTDSSAQFIAGFRQAFALTPQAFFNLSDDQLTVPGSLFAIVCQRGRVVAGARGVLDGAPAVYTGQCYTDPAHRGRRLIAVAVAGLRDWFANSHGVAHAKLVVRMIDGEANPAVISAYRRVGFVEGGMISTKIDPEDDMSRHLLATADPGGILSVRTMSAAPESLASNRAMLRAFGRRAA